MAPDLIVHFGGLAWRSIGGVGYPTIHVRENDTGPDDCNHAQHGAFILAASNNPLPGPGRRGAPARHRADAPGAGRLRRPPLDAGPVARRRTSRGAGEASAQDLDDEEIVRERLSGLGYIA